MADRVAAQSFEVLDNAGNTRAILGLTKSGQPTLELRDAEGKPRAGIQLDEDNDPALRLLDSSGRTRAVFAVGENGMPILGLSDADGRPLAALHLNARGMPGLGLNDRSGKLRAAFSVSEAGSPELVMTDESGYVRLALGFGQRDASVVMLCGSAATNGGPSLVCDPNGTTRLYLQHDREAQPRWVLSTHGGLYARKGMIWATLPNLIPYLLGLLLSVSVAVIAGDFKHIISWISMHPFIAGVLFVAGHALGVILRDVATHNTSWLQDQGYQNAAAGFRGMTETLF